ncbi:MAG: signal peptidase I [Lactobacillales bacterium]|nr:signal peptidase I [Lactobacillales bacterium]
MEGANAQQKKTKVRRKKRKLSPAEIARRKAWRKKQKLKEIGFGAFLTLLLLLGTFLVCHVRFYPVVGNSMSPTVLNRSWILVDKTHEIERFDLIALTPPKNPYSTTNEKVIKRVVGVSGDYLFIREDWLFISRLPFTDKELRSVPDGTIQISIKPEVAQKLKRIKNIPQKSYFVLGDNLEHSVDSRDFGLLTLENIEGRSLLSFLPFERLR